MFLIRQVSTATKIFLQQSFSTQRKCFRLRLCRRKSSQLVWGNTSSEIELNPSYKYFWFFLSIKIPRHERNWETFHPLALRKNEIFECNFPLIDHSSNFEENSVWKQTLVNTFSIFGFIGLSWFQCNPKNYFFFWNLHFAATSKKPRTRLWRKKSRQQLKRSISSSNGEKWKLKAFLGLFLTIEVPTPWTNTMSYQFASSSTTNNSSSEILMPIAGYLACR